MTDKTHFWKSCKAIAGSRLALVAWTAACLGLAVVSLYQAAPTNSRAFTVPLTHVSLSTADATPSRSLPWRTKSIEEVRVGDYVISRDAVTGEISRKQVLETFVRRADHLRVLQVLAADGTLDELRTTDEHPFWVHGEGFVDAGKLRVGAKLENHQGGFADVIAARYEPHPEGVTVYNFKVDDNHTYFVSAHGSRGPPILVHNAEYDLGRNVQVRDQYDELLAGKQIPDGVQYVDNLGPRGGAHGQMPTLRPDGWESHHVIAQGATSAKPRSGAAVLMREQDHALTSSFRSAPAVAAEAELITNGFARELFEQNIDEILDIARRQADIPDTFYDRAVLQAWELFDQQGPEFYKPR